MDLLYPRECCVCGCVLESDERFLCQDCLCDLPRTFFWTWRDNPSEQILWARSYFREVVSLFYYSEDNDYCHLIHEIKYHGNPPLARYLGYMLGRLMVEGGSDGDIDILVPVPLHWRKQWKRGYNQSYHICCGLKKGLEEARAERGRPGEIRIETKLLRRIRYAESQTTKSMEEKWDNVKDAYALNPHRAKKLGPGHHILIVDDVLTSGATAEACYKVLGGHFRDLSYGALCSVGN